MSNDNLDDLAAALRNYDGRDTQYLQAIAERFAASQGYVDGLFACMESPTTRVVDGATWLILAVIRSGVELTIEQTTALIGKASFLTSWAAQLHVCQSVRLLPIDADLALMLAEWLRPLLSSKKPFVRAWSLDAFVHVCALLPFHAGEGCMALEAGLNDPAASVRARARNLG